MNNAFLRNISNIKVTNECFKSLKKLSIDEETTLQLVVQDILEKAMSKKKQKDQPEEK
jgi:hypothetical protein